MTEEYGSKNLELLGAYLYKVLILISILTTLKNLKKKNYMLENPFIALQKREKMMMVKYQVVT